MSALRLVMPSSSSGYSEGYHGSVSTNYESQYQQYANDPDWKSIAKYYISRDAEMQKKIYSKFLQFLNKWNSETMFLSSSTDIYTNSWYIRIIGLGYPVIPFILNELNEENDHLFWALEMITGENPVPEEDYGRINRMADHWIHWGKNNNLI